MYRMLNVACGARYHKNWINIDFHADSSLVRKVNILGGIPFENNAFDVIYSSHFLEHLSLSQAEFVLNESYKVLKKNGILRIVVPDLENICKEYLHILKDACKNDSEEIEQKYDWILLELLDQLVRVNSGGEMQKVFNEISSSKNIKLANYVLMRTGDELLNSVPLKSVRSNTVSKIKNKFLYQYLKVIRFLVPKKLRNLVFVNTSIGERHQWMYDGYSMKKLLEKVGFFNISIKQYNTSDISDFNSYLLDIKKDGTAYKGISSLYIEASK